MFTRSSHAVFECQYHLVWPVKYRRKALIHEQERVHCENILRRAAAEYGMKIGAVEVDIDHVHIFIDIPPQRSVGEAVRILKSLSAKSMFTRFPYLKKKFWSGQLWTAGYFVRTVGEGVTSRMIRRYIEQHADQALGDEQGDLFPKETVRPRRP
jgi:putative transposase